MFFIGKDYAHAAPDTAQPHSKLAGDVSSRQRARPFSPLQLALFARTWLRFAFGSTDFNLCLVNVNFDAPVPASATPATGAQLPSSQLPKRFRFLEKRGFQGLYLPALKRKVMVKIRVIGGSPEGSDSLCKTCTLGHVIKGFRASEELVFCRFFYIEREILFSVRECTF